MKKRNKFWNSTTYKIIRAMHDSGNQPGVIAQWKASVEFWAEFEHSPEAEAVKAWLPVWQVRPFYRAAELAPILPAIGVALGFTDRLEATRSPARVFHELVYGGLSYLQQPNGIDSFRNPQTGIIDFYFIVERVHYWRDRSVSQEEFEEFFT